MIIVMKQNAPLTAVENLETELKNRGFKVSRSQGESKVVLGLIGDTSVQVVLSIRRIPLLM